MKKQKLATKRERKRYESVLKTLEPGTQNYWVLNRLLTVGHITTMQAFQIACITRLSARIYELRHDYGIPIETETRRSRGAIFASYYIGRP